MHVGVSFDLVLILLWNIMFKTQTPRYMFEYLTINFAKKLAKSQEYRAANKSEIQGLLSFKLISFCRKQCSKLATSTWAASGNSTECWIPSKHHLQRYSTLWNMLEVIHNLADDLLWFLSIFLGSPLIVK